MELNSISEPTDVNLGTEVVNSPNNPSVDNKTTPTKTSISVVNNTVVRNSYLKFYLKDNNGVGVSNEDVIVKINSKLFTVTTNSKGLGQLKISLTADKSYNTTINFTGDDYYSSVFKSFKTKVVKTNTTLSVKNTTVIKGKYLYVILKDKNSKVLANKKVYITFNGKTYTSTTNSKGVASLLIKYAPVKKYTTKLTFKGDANYYASTKSLKVTVKQISTFLTFKSLTVPKGDYLVTYLKDENRKALANKKVYVSIAGKSFTLTTNANGEAKLLILTLTPGKTYAATLKFKGNTYYSAVTSYVKVKIAKISTKLTVASTTVNKGDYLVAYLKTKDGKAIAKASVYVTINNKNFTLTTDSNGKAKLLILTLTKGKTYNTTLKYKGSSIYSSSTKNVAIRINGTDVPEFGYSIWMWGADLNNANYNNVCKNLASKGINNIFLYVNEETIYTKLTKLIAAGKPYGIKVHAWFEVFHDSSWISPTTSDGSINQNVFNDRISLAKKIAKIDGIGGIHLDYLRYPGTCNGTTKKINAVNEFARQLSTAVKKINPNVILSAAVMPEIGKWDSKMTIDEYAYGQDIATLSKYLDVICPMVYKGNYGQSSAWIKSTTAAFVKAINGNAKLWVGLQGYRSDNDETLLSISELTKDCNNALAGGADGIGLFRYTFTNIPSFKA